MGILDRFKNLFRKTTEIPEEHEDKEIIVKRRQIQSLVYGISAQLADFWGIPRKEISKYIPRVWIVTERQYPNIDEKLPIGGYSHDSNSIFINEHYAKTYKNIAELTLHLEPVLAEEICHFFYYYITEKKHIGFSKFITEFFGLNSRLYVAEKLNINEFRRWYAGYLQSATNFSNFKRDLDRIIEGLQNYLISPQEIRGARKLFDISNVKDNLTHALALKTHLYYFPAAAYYHEIKKLSPAERYKLLKMKPSEVLNYIIGPQIKKLDEIKKKIEEREGFKVQRERYFKIQKEKGRLPEQLETIERKSKIAPFFQRQAKEAGYKEYGRLKEKVLKTKIPTTKLEKTAEKLAEKAAVGAVTKTVKTKVPTIHAVKTVSKVATAATSLLPKEEHGEFQKEEETELRRAQQKLTEEQKQFEKEEKELLEKAEQKLTEEEKQFQKEEEEELGKASGG